MGLTEKDYLDIVERIQQAMCIEPFQPDVTDVISLIGAWRVQQQEIDRLRTELHRVSESRRGQRERAERAEQEIERLLVDNAELGRECDQYQAEVARLRAAQ